VYREPYPKSLAGVLHEDAIAIDPAKPPDDKVVFRPYTGVAPPRYFDLFTMVERKDRPGFQAITWNSALAMPRLVPDSGSYLLPEAEFADAITTLLDDFTLEGGAQ